MLDKGAQGKVYTVLHEKTQKEMVLKIYDQTNKTEFYKEVQVLKDLKDKEGFPQYISSLWVNTQGEILMNRLGPSLKEVVMSDHSIYKICI